MDPSLWIVVAATILSGFVALNSFSLRSFSRARLEEAFTGSRGRKRLERLEHHLKPLRLTLTLCRTLANLVLIVSLVDYIGLGSWWLLVGEILLAGAIIAVFGVAIPHAWASYGGEKVLSWTLPLLIVLRYLFWPVVAAMELVDLAGRRLSGLSETEAENSDAAKLEIIQAATEGRAEGAVDDDEVEMIESVMEFSTTDAAEIMTPRTEVFALPSETPVNEAAAQIHQAGHTRVPIFTENLDHIVGIVYAKDLLKHLGQQNEAPTLATIARKPFFVPETKTLDDLLREFKARKVHLAIVLDEYGGTSGLVSIEDVIEEIVGDISDEYDPAESVMLRHINATTIEADGRLRIDELNDELDLDLPDDEDYDTVAGYVVSELGYIPVNNETFTTDEAEFTILQANERKISKLRVQKLIRETAEE